MDAGESAPLDLRRPLRGPRVLTQYRWALLVVAVAVLVGLTVPVGQSLVPEVGGLLVLAAAVAIFLAAIPGGPAIAYFLLFPIAIEVTVNGVGVVSALLGTLAVSAAIGLLIGTQPRMFRLCALDVAVFATGAASLVSITVMGQNSSSTDLVTYALDLTTYLVIRTTIGSQRVLLAALWAFSLGGVISAVTGEIMYGLNLSSVVQGRLGVPEVGINAFAAILTGTLGATVGLAARSRWSSRLLLLPMAAVQLAAIVLSASRGAFVALIAMLVVGIFLVGYKHRWTAAIMLIGGTALIWVFLDVPQASQAIGLSAAQARLSTILSSNTLEATQRPYLWRMAIQAFIDHPLFGVGMGNFIDPNTWYALAAQAGAPLILFSGPGDEHNLYLAYLAELGITGAVLILLCAGLATRLIVRLRAVAELTPIALALVGFFTAATFLPLQGNSLTFTLPALLPVLQEVSRRRKHPSLSTDLAATEPTSVASPIPRSGTSPH
jgi:O-antigen ligase